MCLCVCVVAIIKLTFFRHCCKHFLIRIQIGKGLLLKAWLDRLLGHNFGITTLLFIAKLVRIVVGFDFVRCVIYQTIFS